MPSPRTSTACVNCRSRRIKCNESKPRCAQCARAGLFCWGYRDETELRIVSMTGKGDAKRPKRLPSSSDADSSSLSSSSPSRLRPQQQVEALPLPRFNFAVPTESVAQVFFFRHFSVMGADKMYVRQGDASSSLETVKLLGILAVGMAGVANSEGDRRMMALARRKYGLTLHMVNSAIRGDKTTSKEDVMGAVTLLAMFEIIACHDYLSVEAWVCHMLGIASLMRGWTEEDWTKAIKVRVFLHFSYLLVMACIIRRIPVPDHAHSLVCSSRTLMGDKYLRPAAQLFGILCKFAALYASEQTDQVMHITESVSTAMSLEEELVAWKSQVPETWRYTVADGPKGDHHHVYTCAWQASIWNQYRTCRILLHTVLLQYLDTLALPVSQAHPVLSAAYSWQQEASRAVLATMMLEIRESAPYILGLYEATRRSHTLSPEHGGVFALLGSMQVLTGVVDMRGEDAGWFCEMLELMGSRWGIGQALVLGKHLREKSR